MKSYWVISTFMTKSAFYFTLVPCCLWWNQYWFCSFCQSPLLLKAILSIPFAFYALPLHYHNVFCLLTSSTSNASVSNSGLPTSFHLVSDMVEDYLTFKPVEFKSLDYTQLKSQLSGVALKQNWKICEKLLSSVTTDPALYWFRFVYKCPCF